MLRPCEYTPPRLAYKHRELIVKLVWFLVAPGCWIQRGLLSENLLLPSSSGHWAYTSPNETAQNQFILQSVSAGIALTEQNDLVPVSGKTVAGFIPITCVWV